tara:strand:+ start:395 stop:598 length:204 start_codon:yes stop_codon:yes gene_type:complete
MKLFLVAALASSANVFACTNNYIDPDGKNIFFYEECLHMNRGKLTEKLNDKCTKYAKEKLKKELLSK